MINKTSKHMPRCMDHGHVALLQESIDEVLSYLEKANAAIPLIEIVEMYRLSQGCGLWKVVLTASTHNITISLNPMINLGGTVSWRDALPSSGWM
jgi:hypothetical protein